LFPSGSYKRNFTFYLTNNNNLPRLQNSLQTGYIVWGGKSRLVMGRVRITQMHFIGKIHSVSGAFHHSRKATTSFVLSVCPNVSVRSPLDGFQWNSILGDLYENLSRKSKIWL